MRRAALAVHLPHKALVTAPNGDDRVVLCVQDRCLQPADDGALEEEFRRLAAPGSDRQYLAGWEESPETSLPAPDSRGGE